MSKTLSTELDIDTILHVLRNPWGWSEDDVRKVRLAAADLIEKHCAPPAPPTQSG